jgi:predicted metal-dependent phosphoesterase TrpH
MRVDFHMHSDRSDGRLSPRALGAEVASVGLRHWSLTDHDTCAGLEDFADFHGFVPGVEITTGWNDLEVHIVGLGIDPDEAGMVAFLAGIRDTRRRRMAAICEHLQRAHGIRIDPEQVAPPAATAPTRSHLAGFMVEQGHVPWFAEAFKRYLGDEHLAGLDLPAYPAPAEAVQAIAQAGGVSLLAHPGHYRDLVIVDRLLDEGLDGLETNHPGADVGLRQALHHLARKRELVESCGSDFHFPGSRRLGSKPLPGHRLKPLFERLGITS